MIHYGWVVAFTGTLVLVLSHGFGRMSYSVLLPSMVEGLSLTYTQAGLIATGNFMGYLSLAFVGGFLAARFGVRKVVFISLIVISASLFLTGWSSSFGAAFFARLLTGMGNGGSYVPMMALPAAWFAARKRGLAMGIVTMGTGTGLTITGLALPLFISTYGHQGWRYACFSMGFAVFVCSFICLALLRNHPGEKGLSMYGGTDEPAIGDGMAVFSVWSYLAGKREIWKQSSVYFMSGFSYIIYITFIVAYLTQEIGLDPATAGRIFAVLGFFAIFCGIIWGVISDVIGRNYAALLAYCVMATATLLLAFSGSLAGFYVSAVLFGSTAFSVPVIMAAAVGDTVGGRLAPAALGLITVFYGTGQALGPAVAGWMRDASGSFNSAFLLSASVSIVGAGMSLLLKKRPLRFL